MNLNFHNIYKVSTNKWMDKKKMNKIASGEENWENLMRFISCLPEIQFYVLNKSTNFTCWQIPLKSLNWYKYVLTIPPRSLSKSHRWCERKWDWEKEQKLYVVLRYLYAMRGRLLVVCRIMFSGVRILRIQAGIPYDDNKHKFPWETFTTQLASYSHSTCHWEKTNFLLQDHKSHTTKTIKEGKNSDNFSHTHTHTHVQQLQIVIEQFDFLLKSHSTRR